MFMHFCTRINLHGLIFFARVSKIKAQPPELNDGPLNKLPWDTEVVKYVVVL
jgi:hypothetical protein